MPVAAAMSLTVWPFMLIAVRSRASVYANVVYCFILSHLLLIGGEIGREFRFFLREEEKAIAIISQLLYNEIAK